MVNWSEISIFISAIAGCVVSVIIATQKSKCTSISFLCGCCKCQRKLDVADDLENQLQNVQEITQETEGSTTENETTKQRNSETQSTTTTPRKSDALTRYEEAIRKSSSGYRLPVAE